MKKVLLVLLSLGLLLFAAGCGAQASAESPAAASTDQAAYVEAYGVVKSTDVRNITLEFQAPVVSVQVKDGQRVGNGQPLVSLDMTEVMSQLSNKELELQAAQSELGTSFSTSNPDLRKLQNDLKNAQAVYNKDKSDLASKQGLYDAGSISLTELDAAKRLVESDLKAVEDINYAIASMQNSKGTLKDQKSIQAATLEADLKLLKSRLGKSFIKGSDIVSDINNGLVYDIGYVAGDIASPQKKLLSILDLDKLIVQADVPEEFIKGVKLDAEATVIPTADKSKQYKGKVSYISGKATRNNGETLVAVQITLDKPDEFLLPEYNVDVQIKNAQ